MEPKFYVLTMAYNCEAFIKEAIDSVRDFAEHIVIVEGNWSLKGDCRSTDATFNICRELSEKYSNISLIPFLKYLEPLCYVSFKTVRHEDLVANAIAHPYYDGIALQNQMLARDMGVSRLEEVATKNNHINDGFIF